MGYPEDRVKMTDERVAQILSDIAEGIDGGEGRTVLRAALKRHYAIMAEVVDRMQSKQTDASLKLLELSTKLLEGAYSHVKEC